MMFNSSEEVFSHYIPGYRWRNETEMDRVKRKMDEIVNQLLEGIRSELAKIDVSKFREQPK